MKKKITNLIIVDASSSMRSKKEEIIDGLKDLISDIKKDMKNDGKDIKTRTIICQFATAGTFQVLINTTSRKKLKKSLADDYEPNGMTALYDAIGQAFNLVGKKQDGVFVNVLTDGEENDSKEYTSDMIKKLIAEADEKKWGVTFMGTTKEAIHSAQYLGFKASNTYQYVDSKIGTKMSNRVKGASRDMYMRSVKASMSKADIKTEGLMDDVDDNTIKKEEGKTTAKKS